MTATGLAPRTARRVTGLAAVVLAAILASDTAMAQSGASAAGAISAYRRQHGLPPVTADPSLMQAAQHQASAMARAGRLDHNVAGPLSRRLPASMGAENIAMGTRDFATTLAMWKRSPGHNANLLSRGMTRIGIASARSSHSRYGTFWALVMAGTPTVRRASGPPRMHSAAGLRRGAVANEGPQWRVLRELGVQ